eukprot:jgi/Ulvmu1/4088/UM019_0067.1
MRDMRQLLSKEKHHTHAVGAELCHLYTCPGCNTHSNGYTPSVHLHLVRLRALAEDLHMGAADSGSSSVRQAHARLTSPPSARPARAPALRLRSHVTQGCSPAQGPLHMQMLETSTGRARPTV